MSQSSMKSLFAVALLASAISGSAMAQDSTMPVVTPAVPPAATVAAPITAPVSGAMARGEERAAEVNAREAKEQSRIDKGIADGKLTAGEATKTQEKLNTIENKTKMEEAKQGGALTKKETVKLNGRLNKESKLIHKKVHNTKVVTPVVPATPIAQ